MTRAAVRLEETRLRLAPVRPVVLIEAKAATFPIVADLCADSRTVSPSLPSRRTHATLRAHFDDASSFETIDHGGYSARIAQLPFRGLTIRCSFRGLTTRCFRASFGATCRCAPASRSRLFPQGPRRRAILMWFGTFPRPRSFATSICGPRTRLPGFALFQAPPFRLYSASWTR